MKFYEDCGSAWTVMYSCRSVATPSGHTPEFPSVTIRPFLTADVASFLLQCLVAGKLARGATFVTFISSRRWARVLRIRGFVVTEPVSLTGKRRGIVQVTGAERRTSSTRHQTNEVYGNCQARYKQWKVPRPGILQRHEKLSSVRRN